MKNKIKRGQTARRAQLLNTTRTWLSKMIAMFIAAFLLYGNVGTAFAGELSLDAAGTENIGEASSAYVLAGAGTGEEQTSRQEEVTQPGETAESGAEQTGGPETAAEGGRDVVVHFGDGEGQEIAIHVNPETNAPKEAVPAEGTEEKEPESSIPFETETETETLIQQDKKVYTYEDAQVRVTATLEKEGAIPADAVLRVTPVTPDGDGYNYDAYMDALNESAAQSAPETAGESDVPEDDAVQPGMKKLSGDALSKTYNGANTLLYDIAFIAPEYDKDGNPIEGSSKEYEPTEGSVSVSIAFKSNQLSDGLSASADQDVAILHLPVSEEAKDGSMATSEITNLSAEDISVEKVQADVSVTGQESADFEVSHFSVFAAANPNAGSAIKVNIAFQDANGDAVNPAPDMSKSRLYAYVRDTNNSNRIVRELTKEGASYTATISGLYDQNGHTNNGSLFPLDSSHQYEMTLFSYGDRSYGETEQFDMNEKQLLEDGMALNSLYVLNLPEQLRSRCNPVTPGYEYTAIAQGFGAAGAETYLSILGDAVNFGIVTENFDLSVGDAETNVAAFIGKCVNQTGNDLTNKVEQTFILAQIEDTFGIKGYPAYVKVPKDYASQIVEKGINNGGHLTIDTSQTKDELLSEVRAMLTYVKDQSKALLEKADNTCITYNSDQKYDVDLTGRGAGTYYINVSDEMYDRIMSEDSKLRIRKENDQTIVFNVAKSGSLIMHKFNIITNGAERGADNYLNTQDPVPQTIIWNMPNAEQITVSGSITGVVLAKNANVLNNSTSSGWLVSKKVTIGNGEWHNVYQHVEKLSDSVILRAVKTINHSTSAVSGFTFTLDCLDGAEWKTAGSVQNTKGAIVFSGLDCLNYTADDFVPTGTNGQGQRFGRYRYRITESAGDVDEAGNRYIEDSRSYYAEVIVTEVTSKDMKQGGERIVYRASSPKYYYDEAFTHPIPQNGLPAFNNTPDVKTQIPLQKTWQDNGNANGNRPDQIIIHLFADGKEIQQAEVKPSSDGSWNYTFTDLSKYTNDNGVVRPIVYTVTEEPVAHYTLSGNTAETDAQYNTSIYLVNTEESGYSLPATGGEGTRRIYLLSLVLIALAGAGLIRSRRRGHAYRICSRQVY